MAMARRKLTVSTETPALESMLQELTPEFERWEKAFSGQVRVVICWQEGNWHVQFYCPATEGQIPGKDPSLRKALFQARELLTEAIICWNKQRAEPRKRLHR